MRLLHLILVFAFLVQAGVVANAQSSSPAKLTLDEVVERYINARGGRDALNAITSLTFTADLGNGRIRKMIKMRPYYFLVGCSEPTCGIAEGFDGSAWEASPKRKRVIRARLEAAKSLRRVSEFDEPLIGWREKGHKAELIGLETFQGRKVYRIDMVLNDGLQGSSYIDAETFLILGSRGRVPMHSRAEHFDVLNLDEDYRRVAGVLYPFRIRTVDALSGKTVSGDRGWDTIEANVPYDRSFFSPPTVTPEPLTALTEYLLSVAGSVSPASQWFSPYLAFRKNPDNSAIDSENDLNWLGYELLKQNALEDALIVFRTLVQEHPNSANAYDSLGDGLAQAGRINEAIKAFDVAVKLNPQANATKEKLESLKKTGRIPPQY